MGRSSNSPPPKSAHQQPTIFRSQWEWLRSAIYQAGPPLAKAPHKRKRPRLIESWDARRTALPRSLLTNSLRFSARSGNGSEVLFTRLVRRSPKHPTNENAPDSLSLGTLVEQPSPEVCSPAAYDFPFAVGMAPKCYLPGWSAARQSTPQTKTPQT